MKKGKKNELSDEEKEQLNAIKELLGHSSLSSTEIYTKNSMEQLKKSYVSYHPRESN